MRLWSTLGRSAGVLAVAGLCALTTAPDAGAQNAVDPDAQSVLASMSHYLSGLKSFSVEYSAVDEVLTTSGQKLQFVHSGDIVGERPNHLFAIRRGAAGIAELFLDGKQLTLFSKGANVYLQWDARSIDNAIDVMHDLGFDAPGADLLGAKPLDSATTDMTSGAHIGMTFIDGIEVHQLAFRGADVDWQLWVTAGDKPLPVRYVITTKGAAGAPEFTLQLKNWKTAPQLDAKVFAFMPPQGSKKLDPSSVTVNSIGDLTIKAK
jgi:hypothetical protein